MLWLFQHNKCLGISQKWKVWHFQWNGRSNNYPNWIAFPIFPLFFSQQGRDRGNGREFESNASSTGDLIAEFSNQSGLFHQDEEEELETIHFLCWEVFLSISVQVDFLFSCPFFLLINTQTKPRQYHKGNS